MRVLIFSTNYLPNIGGAELAIASITDRIECDEAQFDLIVPRLDGALPKKERIGNIDVYRVGFGIPLDKFFVPFFGLIKAMHLSIGRSYEFVWVMMASQASIAAAFYKMWYSKVRLILTLQEGDEEEHLKRYVFGNQRLYEVLIKPWHTLVFKKADMITVISEWLRDRALSYGVQCPIYVIPNGVDTKQFGKELTARQHSALMSKLGTGKNDVFLITTSRLVKKNAVGDIIAALSKLPSKVKLLIIGGGEEYTKLKQMVHDAKLDGRVQFMGALQNHELPAFLKASDIFVRPSLSEGFGISFIEAMAAGLPVIATQVGGIKDFLFDPSQNSRGATGLVVEPHSPEQIAENVERLLSDSRLREKLVKNAKKMVEKKYNWDTVTKQMKEQVFGIK